MGSEMCIRDSLIWYGLTWSLELYQQTNARLWRQGQTQTVTIHHIVTKNTVDEDVLAALASKDVTQEKLIAAVKARLSCSVNETEEINEIEAPANKWR